MKGNARIFKSQDKNGNEVTLKFVRPNQATIAKGDLKFREAYSRAFRSGVLVNAEVMKMLRERGIWDDEKDAEVDSLRVKLAELEEKLETDHSISNEVGEDIVLEMKKIRLEIARLNSAYTSVVDNTCESIGGEARNQYFAATCVVDSKGSKVFKDMDDFLARLDEQVALDSYREAVIAGLEDQLNVELPSDLSSHYPENKWLASRKKEDEPEKAEPTQEEPKSKKKKSV